MLSQQAPIMVVPILWSMSPQFGTQSQRENSNIPKDARPTIYYAPPVPVSTTSMTPSSGPANKKRRIDKENIQRENLASTSSPFQIEIPQSETYTNHGLAATAPSGAFPIAMPMFATATAMEGKEGNNRHSHTHSHRKSKSKSRHSKKRKKELLTSLSLSPKKKKRRKKKKDKDKKKEKKRKLNLDERLSAILEKGKKKRKENKQGDIMSYNQIMVDPHGIG